MKCWYKSKDPVLRLKPQKVERIWMNPQIYLLRDIITDNEIAMIKEQALPNVSATSTLWMSYIHFLSNIFFMIKWT